MVTSNYLKLLNSYMHIVTWYEVFLSNTNNFSNRSIWTHRWQTKQILTLWASFIFFCLMAYQPSWII